MGIGETNAENVKPSRSLIVFMTPDLLRAYLHE